MKISSVIGALACGFFVVTFAVAQTPSKDDLRAEMSILKQIVQNQEKRIAALGRTIAELKASQNPPQQKETSKSESLTPGDWKVPSNWDRVVLGMSLEQVTEILGRSTNQSLSVGSAVTLFYEGDVSGSGYVSGNVKFFENRVTQINKPVF
jgi:hypothetical protein